MNETGDPDTPHAADPTRPTSGRREPSREELDHDDLIGFGSPGALAGRPRTPPAPESLPEPLPEPADDEPELPFVEAFPSRVPGTPFEPLAASIPAPTPEPLPAWAIETPEAERPVTRFGRRETTVDIEGAMSLYAVYALILFSVPTLGVAAAIALLAVFGRAGPAGEVAASHFLYQQRTLYAAAGLAVLGGVLIALGLGVFVLFILAVWLILRGAFGVLKLKAGHPIPRPRSWLF